MTDDVIDTVREPKSEQTSLRGRPQREGVAITLKELGFYDRLPKIRQESRDYLLSSREQLLGRRPAPKMTRDLALATREQFLTRQKGKKLIEPYKVTLTTLGFPGAPNTQNLPPQELIQYGEVDLTGSGLGFDEEQLIGAIFLGAIGLALGGKGYDDNVYKTFAVDWFFDFTAPQTGQYLISTQLTGWGNYVLISDDGPFDSHEVSMSLAGSLDVSGQGTSRELFDRTGANINEAEGFLGGDTFQINPTLNEGDELKIHAALAAVVMARGDNTFAQMDMTQAVGGLMCTGVSVEPLS